jgi:aldose 1-epimerase
MRFVPLLLLLSACATTMPEAAPVTSRWFGLAADGRAAKLWTLRVPGLEVDVMDLGATVVAVRMPDRAGKLGDVALGFDDVAGYQSAANQYFGCTTGRVCNRIANGTFALDGYTYHLATNNGPHHLHGGAVRSLDKVWWQGEALAGQAAVRCRYRSPDGEEGYPGNLDVQVTFTLLAAASGGASELRIDYEARTDRSTPINLTNHTYWNLAGAGAPTVLDHTLRVDAEQFTESDATLIPTGRLLPVEGTPLNFRRAGPLGARVGPLLATPAGGYDHNYVLAGADLRTVARLAHPESGRWLEVATTEPGLQLYTGNFLDGQRGRGGASYARHAAVCLETQHFPDSVNRPTFPSTILEPGDTFASTTIYRLGLD